MNTSRSLNSLGSKLAVKFREVDRVYKDLRSLRPAEFNTVFVTRCGMKKGYAMTNCGENVAAANYALKHASMLQQIP